APQMSAVKSRSRSARKRVMDPVYLIVDRAAISQFGGEGLTMARASGTLLLVMTNVSVER
ncbi:MAG TPA: hypothetical protein DD437_14360, partial [Rhodobiaceae bacterium]|nr:hypothetical protein [Rhodobiaceae bacterium]